MELHVLGHNVERVDARAKATGDARFTVDLVLPGMLHTRFVRSPHPHALIQSIEVTAALGLPGVHARCHPYRSAGHAPAQRPLR